MACARFLFFWEDASHAALSQVEIGLYWTGDVARSLGYRPTHSSSCEKRSKPMAMGRGTTLSEKDSRFIPVGPQYGGVIPMPRRSGWRPKRRKNGPASCGMPWRITGDYTNDAFMVFDSLIGWATNNKANARVGFFPGPGGTGRRRYSRSARGGGTYGYRHSGRCQPAGSQPARLTDSLERRRPRSVHRFRDLRRANHCLQCGEP